MKKTEDYYISRLWQELSEKGYVKVTEVEQTADGVEWTITLSDEKNGESPEG